MCGYVSKSIKTSKNKGILVIFCPHPLWTIFNSLGISGILGIIAQNYPQLKIQNPGLIQTNKELIPIVTNSLSTTYPQKPAKKL